MSSYKSKKTIGIILFLIAIVLLVLNIYKMGQGTATKQFSLTAYIVMALAFLYQLTVLRSKDKGQGK